jgi:hypothetical protein
LTPEVVLKEKMTSLMLVLAVTPGMLKTKSAVPCTKGLCGLLPAMDGLAFAYAVELPAVPPIIKFAGVRLGLPAKPFNRYVLPVFDSPQATTSGAEAPEVALVTVPPEPTLMNVPVLDVTEPVLVVPLRVKDKSLTSCPASCI